MHCIYVASDPVNAEILKDYLATHGVTATVQGSFGWGGIGELAADAYPRLYVDDARTKTRGRALALAWEREQQPAGGAAWACAQCGEAHGGQFSECWRCGHQRFGS